MKKTILEPNMVPTANIAVNKSRLKVYKYVGDLPTYYLQKGQEFQIELFNPTTDVVLAKIILNGNAISQGGLVLNPGQRIYLDRYLDVAKKFLFDTYEVGKSAEVMAAIKNNGDFRVEFYREQKPTFVSLPDYTYRPHIYFNNGLAGNNFYSGTPSHMLRSSGTGSITSTNNSTQTTLGLSGAIGRSSSFASTQANAASTYTSSIATQDMLNLSGEMKAEPQSLRRMKSAIKTKSIETGRVEMGSDSDQKLKYVDKTFDYYAFHTIEYKMLPVSQKINTVEDINVKRYCTQCGAKVGRTDNFCASCGKKA